MPIPGIIASSKYVNTALSGFVGIDSYVFPNSSQNSITFSAIPQGYKHLYIFYQAWGTVNDGTRMYFNGDTTSGNYLGASNVNGSGSTVGVYPPTSQTGIVDQFSLLGGYGSDNSTAGYAYINDYSKTNKFKTIFGIHSNINSSNEGYTAYSGGTRIGGNDAITSITLTTRTGNFNTNSKISLFAIN